MTATSIKILVINPNSTKEMTKSIEFEINTLHISQCVEIDYYTGPTHTRKAAPPSINNNEDAEQSTQACLQDFQENPKYLEYDGYLIACYSDHPLVYQLPKLLSSQRVVMGIFQASMLYSMHYATSGCKTAILTSSIAWEKLLDDAIIKYCGNVDVFPDARFNHSLACNIPVLELHHEKHFPVIQNKITQLQNNNVGIILLGCAGLSCLHQKMKRFAPNIKFVDSVKVGIKLLIAYVDIGET